MFYLFLTNQNQLQMENQVSSKSIILNYGLALGIISLFPSIIKYALGENYLENDIYTLIISIVLTIVFVIISIKKIKILNNGFLSWGQGLKAGVGVVLISMIIVILYLLIFSNFIEPDFKQLAIEAAEQKWIDAGMSDEQIEISRDMANKYFNLSLYGSTVLASLFFGFVISAIVSAIMQKREEDTF